METIFPSSREVSAALDHATPDTGKTDWSVGSLTYDKRGLTRLFVWLQCGDFCWEVKNWSIRDTVRLVIGKLGISNAGMGLLLVSFPQILSLVLNPVSMYKRAPSYAVCVDS